MNGKPMTRAEIESWLKDFLQQHFDIAPERIQPDTDIYQDLDLDSIDAADIVLKFNEVFGRKIDVRAFREVRTLTHALDTLLR